MTILQVYNGHANAEFYDVIVTFEIDGKEYGAHFTFDRPARTLVAHYFFEDVTDNETREIAQPDGVAFDEIEVAAREYLGHLGKA